MMVPVRAGAPGAALLVIALLPPAAGAAEPQSIATTPVDTVIGVGAIQPFTATATFSDATTGRLSNATIAAGFNHTCVLQVDGFVQCWGQNGSGQLGNFSTSDAPTPVTANAAGNAVAVTAGGDHSCLLEADGTVRCWGRNDSGQVGNGTTAGQTSPVLVSGLSASTVIALSAGASHTCALFAAGSVKCWGANNAGQLGNGTLANASTPVTVSGITTAIAIAAGGNHSCAALASGTVQCWGADGSGQLGNGAAGASTTPTNVTGLSNAVAVTSGFDHSCALLAGGTIKCWGLNLEGQLGDGSFVSRPTPVPAATQLITRKVAVSAGTGHTCAVAEGGLAVCWGGNGNGQVGNGTVVGTFPNPVAVSGLNPTNGLDPTPIAVATGFAHSCALLADGRVRCWGRNDNGQLGAGSALQRSGTPLAVSGTVVGMNAGGAHTCVVTPTGAVDCWGSGDIGQLGYGGTADSSIPLQVAPPLARDAGSVALGDGHTCIARLTGDVACTGDNAHGQLGGLPGNQVPFQLVPDVISQSPFAAVALASGGAHTCAIRVGGTVRCWGRNNVGQLGNSLPFDQATPTNVAGVTGAQRITAGLQHTCVLISAGNIQCWGSGTDGQLGNGQGANSSSPVLVGNFTTATAIAAGDFHTCARLVGGTVLCWGLNFDGQLGNGSNTQSNVPVIVSGITTAVAVAAGHRFSCALLSGGLVRCWGQGSLGQLGNGGFASVNTPVNVGGLTGAVAIDAGLNHTCVVRTGGAVQCWGSNFQGQLGDGTTSNSATPTPPVSGINLDAAALAWSSSNPAVATVDMSGRVFAVGLGETSIRAEYGGKSRTTLLTVAPDTDGDSVLDPLDNCLLVTNPTQLDADLDGYGNICDADLNNSGLVTTADFGILRSVLNQSAGSSATAAAADLNGSGTVTAADFGILRASLNTEPGPSGLFR